MSAPAEEFYSEERWQNWLDRLRDEDIDPDDEGSARLLLNLQDDVAIAVAKIVRAHSDGLDSETALSELTSIRDLVLGDVDIDDQDAAMLLDTVQLSLVGVFAAAEQYLIDGVTDEADIETYLRSAAEAEAEGSLDEALGLIAAAGTQVIDGDSLDVSIAEEIDYGHVSEWINGLDSLQSALSDPEVIEEAED